MTYEQMKKHTQDQKQLDMIQSILEWMEVVNNSDESYEDREYTLLLLLGEMKEYFGED